MHNTDAQEALEALKTDDALQKKLTGKQFLALVLATLVLPIIMLITVGSTL